jgi:23S rRNA (cytidine1920-2'-O)/16S rRNA (cytidine1409-2'-O)-methyltransferase
MKQRLDQYLAQQGLVTTRSQAESYIKLGRVKVNKQTITKPSFLVSVSDEVKLATSERYVSRAGLKLASVADAFKLKFEGKTVLDVGSSTGGFTDYALQHGAGKVIAVDVGTDQLHPSLLGNPKIELHEKTDIRELQPEDAIDIVLIDVSFISLRDILPYIATIVSGQAVIVAMVKPQFEAGKDGMKHKGVIKNERMRRDVLKSFESWAQNRFVVLDKADSQVSGRHGNQERFYLLRKA